MKIKLSASAIVSFVACVVLTGCLPETPSQANFEDIHFEPIALDEATVTEYPFLQNEMKDIEKERARFAKYHVGDIQNENDVYVAPQFSFGSVSYDQRPLFILRADGASRCGTAGCSHSFYVENEPDQFRFIKSITAHDIRNLVCQREVYLIALGGGDGARTASASAWELKENQLEQLGPVDAVDPLSSCKQLTKGAAQ